MMYWLATIAGCLLFSFGSDYAANQVTKIGVHYQLHGRFNGQRPAGSFFQSATDRLQ